MKTDPAPKLYEECQRAFLAEIARTVEAVLSRVEGMPKEEKAKLAESVLFGVAAHLSGSSFGGRVAGEEVYPKLGFYRGEASDTLLVGPGVSLHTIVPEVIANLRNQT
jgi:hypothetical protein